MPKEIIPVRVLVVDDCALVREMISAILAEDSNVVIVGYAHNGIEAIAQTLALKPDVITMDIEMPVMGGLHAIESIMAQHPVPILALTSHSGVRIAFDAVSKGALDVLEKSDLSFEDSAKFIKKLKQLARIDILRHLKNIEMSMQPAPAPAAVAVAPLASALKNEKSKKLIVAIASSTGGPKALGFILSRLPASFPIPIVISQHVADGFTQGLAEWLNSSTALTVSTARKGVTVKPGFVYLNPSESSMRISKEGVITLTPSAPGQVYHPSCDHLLYSVAQSYASQAIGVVLSGMGDDGVAGMQALKASGAYTMAQDEKSSIVYGMNGLAVQKGYIHKVLSLEEISQHLIRLAGQGVE